MCGRTACTLDPDGLTKACQYKDKNGNKRQPKWKSNDSQKYYPSYNISPQSYTPVLVSCKTGSRSMKQEFPDEERELQAMKWGLVPSWHRGDPASFGYKMNNARIESITEKKSFKGALEKGRRCVVLAEGFYEWQEVKSGGPKQPYFIYFKDNMKSKGSDEANNDGIKPARPLLTMAGIFDVWQSSLGEEPLYSYSVITLEAKPPFRSIHHRVPAILKDEDAVRQWLDCSEIKYEQALKLLSTDDCLAWHPVSKAVSNSRYKEADCIKEIDL
ncbi:embryonic stem cell-specific 5-hydroxymethylcytosine-binding protein-like isoform X2 [Dendronephthya gigantea]|nr:embryonic stem cell-specific 5-hydroxymethylcytosine-binding protein-like isoform X2 [Dendronephthya gigantea]